MNEKRLAVGGAILTAFAASLCCIGPLVFAALGIGAFGAASLFESARPYLLGIASLLLAFGFYRAYFRRAEACAPGEACATKPVNKTGRVALWIGLVGVVAFALSPYYAGAIAARLNAGTRPDAETQTIQPVSNEEKVIFNVSGMTCTSCAVIVQSALEKTQGVRLADVSYQRGEAVVTYDARAVTIEQLREALNQTGYKVDGWRGN